MITNIPDVRINKRIIWTRLKIEITIGHGHFSRAIGIPRYMISSSFYIRRISEIIGHRRFQLMLRQVHHVLWQYLNHVDRSQDPWDHFWHWIFREISMFESLWYAKRQQFELIYSLIDFTSSCFETFSVSWTSLAFDFNVRRCMSERILARWIFESLSDWKFNNWQLKIRRLSSSCHLRVLLDIPFVYHIEHKERLLFAWNLCDYLVCYNWNEPPIHIILIISFFSISYASWISFWTGISNLLKVE